MKKETKRLTFNIDIEFHNYIKHRAIEMNIHMKHWVLLAILKQIQEEKLLEKE